MPPNRLLSLAVLLVLGCSLDGAGKDRCVANQDCVPGKRCQAGRCVAGSAELDGAAGAVDALAPRPPDAPATGSDAPLVADGAPAVADGPSPEAPPAPPDAAPAVPVDAPVLKKPDGVRCESGDECQSTFCADGACCNGSCQGLCRSCNVQGRVGTCTMLRSGEDPADECTADSSETCDRDGFCDGMGACRLWARGVTCAIETCAGAVHTFPSACDGAGNCKPAGSEDCVPFHCRIGARCSETCTGPAQCVSPAVCTGGFCVGAKENCGNASDDDGDGMIDCADPDCGAAGYQCMPAAPGGWTGPAVLQESTGGAIPTCTAPYPNTTYSGRSGLTCSAVTCSPCSCGPPDQVTCQAPSLTGAAGVEVSGAVASGGACLPQGGSVTVGQPSWTGAALVCNPFQMLWQGGCAITHRCAPSPPAGFHKSLCVFAVGDRACPAPYNVLRRVFHGGLTDDRACTPCRCGDPTGVDCSGTAEPTASGGSCQHSGGVATGTCTPTAPTTVCCL